MKKTNWIMISAIVVAAGIAGLSLTACSKSESEPSQAPSTNQPAKTPAPATNAAAPTAAKTAPDANEAAAKKAATVQYTCPMHPDVVQDKPGNCPKCGLKLVEKK
jgi:hypothetical protein